MVQDLPSGVEYLIGSAHKVNMNISVCAVAGQNSDRLDVAISDVFVS